MTAFEPGGCQKSPEEVLRKVTEALNNNCSKYLILTNFTRNHYFNYLTKALKENLQVFTAKTDRQANLDNFDDKKIEIEMLKIAKELEKRAIKACMVMDPYRLEMLKTIYEIKVKTNNLELFADLEQLEVGGIVDKEVIGNCSDNSNVKCAIFEEMKKIFNSSSSICDENIQSDDYVPPLKESNEIFIDQFVREMKDETNLSSSHFEKQQRHERNYQKFWLYEYQLQHESFRTTMSEIRAVVNADTSINTYHNTITKLDEIFGAENNKADSIDYYNELIDNGHGSYNQTLLEEICKRNRLRDLIQEVLREYYEADLITKKYYGPLFNYLLSYFLKWPSLDNETITNKIHLIFAADNFKICNSSSFDEAVYLFMHPKN